MSDDLLLRFRNEVLEKGPESTMPQNLTDEWLGILSSEEILRKYGYDDEGCSQQIITGAVLHILVNKYSDREQLQFSYDELLGFISQYSLELALEILNRDKEERFIRPTIETIFENRDVLQEMGFKASGREGKEFYAITKDNVLVCIVEADSPEGAMGAMTGHLCNSIIEEFGEDFTAIDAELGERFGKYDDYRQDIIWLSESELSSLREQNELSEFEPFFCFVDETKYPGTKKVKNGGRLKILNLNDECAMCGGSGGWPHPFRPNGMEKCKICNGAGKQSY